MTGRRSQITPARLTERLSHHPIALGLTGLLLAVVLAYASWVVAEGVPFLQKYKVNAIVPADGPIVRKGDEVRIAGQLAGKVEKVSNAGDGRLVRMRLFKNTPIHSDARATVEVRGLAGAVHIGIVRGTRGPDLPSGATIPRASAQTGEDLASVAAGFDAAARHAMGVTLQEYGGGLTGTGADLNQALGDLPSLTTDGRSMLRALTPQPGMLAGVFGDLGRLAQGFTGPMHGDLGRFVDSGDAVVSTLASDKRDVTATLDEVPRLSDQTAITLPEADHVLGDLDAAAGDLSPGFAALRRSLPGINTLMADPKRLDRLPVLTRAADPVVRRGVGLLHQVGPFSQTIAPLIDPLIPTADYLTPYRTDIVEGTATFSRTSQKYAVGFAYPSPANAIRFTPVFTCMPGRDAFPAPGESIHQQKKCLVP
jgi:virulence factor Mce-like protein